MLGGEDSGREWMQGSRPCLLWPGEEAELDQWKERWKDHPARTKGSLARVNGSAAWVSPWHNSELF